jgi:aspartate kinase
MFDAVFVIILLIISDTAYIIYILYYINLKKRGFSMNGTKVVKFGGSSLADAKQFKKVADIIHSDKSRRFVVASAPGKRFDNDIKITDMLYNCYEKASRGENFDKEFTLIEERYNSIIRDLGLDMSLEEEFKYIRASFAHSAGRDYAASRGEYLNSMLLAKYLGFPFLDTVGLLYFNESGSSI